MMAGAILGGADEEQTAQIEKAASAIGLAFQIQDDILDVTSTSRSLANRSTATRKIIKSRM